MFDDLCVLWFVIRWAEWRRLGENSSTRAKAFPFRDFSFCYQRFPPKSQAWWRGFWTCLQGKIPLLKLLFGCLENRGKFFEELDLFFFFFDTLNSSFLCIKNINCIIQWIVIDTVKRRNYTFLCIQSSNFCVWKTYTTARYQIMKMLVLKSTWESIFSISFWVLIKSEPFIFS